jgi:hypothetical protein
MHIARCYRLIDLGTQPKSYQGQAKGEARKIMASWEILGDERMPDGKPFTISKSWFLSMHEKATLRKDLESWRGRPFSLEEESSFDVSKLLGAYCMVNCTQSETNGKTYTNVAGLTPLPGALKNAKPAPVHANVIFDLDKPDMKVFEGFHEKLQDAIKKSPEWAQLQKKSSGFEDMPNDLPEDEPFATSSMYYDMTTSKQRKIARYDY